jgi:maleamate amidohydrolase
MSTAVLIIDLQKDFFKQEYADQTKAEEVQVKLCENINRLLHSARKQHLPVIFVCTSLSPDRSDWNLRMRDLDSAVCIQGTPGEELIPGIEQEKNDRIVLKKRYSAFFNTRLEEILRSLSVPSLIVCGINTHACVRTTVVDAFMRNYRVFIPVDCVASYDEDQGASSLEYMAKRVARVLSLDEMVKLINSNQVDFLFQP